MKQLIFVPIILISIFSCKKKPQIENTFETKKIEHPTHQVDYFDFTNEEIQKYKASFKRLEAPKFKGTNSEEILLFPFTDWMLTASILKEENYTNSDINNFLKYGGQLDKKEKFILRNNVQTKLGFSLNTTEEELTNFFGKPHSFKEHDSNTSKHLSWEFTMMENTETIHSLQPYLSNKLSYTIDAYFEKKELKALIYAYKVPKL